MDVNNTQNVMKLEGARNWNVWKFQTTVLLRGQGWLDIVEGRAVKPEEATARIAWESRDAKAQTLLVTRMTENVMLHLISCKSSAEMWRKLLSVYEQKSETSIHILQQRFFQYKYESGIEMSVFLSKIQEMQNQLKQMGEEISEKFTITKVLMCLPDEYKHFVSAWESAPDDKQTFDNLMSRLLIEEERVKEKTKDAQESSSAFVAKRNVKCFKCGKHGHYQTECRSNGDSEKKMNDKKCYYCGKVGHFKAQCRFKKSNDNKKMSNAFVVSNSDYEQYEETRWLVDSGASDHMCRDRSLFSSFSNISQRSVILGDGAAISVQGCGQMAVQVKNGREWIDTTINNVLFVPDLKTNLFSVNRASDRGYVMVTNDTSCKFYKKGVVCAIANRIESSYYLDFRYKCEVASIAKVSKNDLNEWHERLAHQNFDHVKKVLEKNNMEIKQTQTPQCESCLKGKIHRLPFKKGEKGLMVGYEENSKGYRIYFAEKNCVYTKRDVVILNEQRNQESEPTVMLNLNNSEPMQDELPETVTVSEEAECEEFHDTQTSFDHGESESQSEYEPSDDGSLEDDETQVQNERPKHIRKQTSFYTCHNVVSEDNEPVSYREAMKSREASKWREAVNRELQTLKDNDTWDFCDLPANETVISSKWVFKLKGSGNDKQYKARLVARGFQQNSYFDLGDIYAPVARLPTFRVFVVVAMLLLFMLW